MIAASPLPHLGSGGALDAAILDHTPVPLVLMKPDGTVLRANRAFALYHGREPSFFSGKDFFALFPNSANQALFRRVAESGRPEEVLSLPFDHPWHPERGTTYWNWGIVPVLGLDGGVEALLSTSVDVTELVQSEQALRRSEERYRALVEESLQGILILRGPSPRVEFANRRCAEMTGYSVEELLALGPEDLPELVHPDDRKRLFGRLAEHLAGRDAPSTGEYRAIVKGGAVRTIRYFASSVPCGGHPCIQVSFVDVTERKAAERKLRHVRKRLARRVRELSAVHAASRRLAELRAPQELAQSVITTLEETLAYEHGSVLLVDEASGDLVPFAVSNPGGTPESLEAESAHLSGHRQGLRMGITGWVAKTGQSVRLGNTHQDARYYPVREGMRSKLCVPLRLGERVLGVVNVESSRLDAYGPSDQLVLETVATSIAIAVENARLYGRERRRAAELESYVAQRTKELAEAVRRSQEELDRRHRVESELTVQSEWARELEARVSRRSAELTAAVQDAANESARRRQAEMELLRSHRLVTALNRVSTRLHEGLDVRAALEALAPALECEDLLGLVLYADADPGRLSILHASAAPDALARYEAVAGRTFLSRTFPADVWPFSEVLADAKPVFAAEMQVFFPACFPELLPEEGDAQVRALGILPETPAILAPFPYGQRQGILVVAGSGLVPQDVPAIALLADQLASGLERLRLERRAAEAEILREVNRLRAELIGNVSHEIRTPLGIIDVLTTTMLARDVAFDSETQLEFLTGIKEATDRLAAIVQNLLQLSRTESGRLVPDRRPADLAEVASAAIGRMKTSCPHHRLLLRTPEPHFPAMVDAEQIDLVLGNLLANAVKYSPDGGDVVVSLAWKGDDLLLAVSDQGIGIPDGERERIFERFYRVDSPDVRRAGGTGLGLAVCRTIVEAHGGTIWVESLLGAGSTFFVSLPAGTVKPVDLGGVE